MKTLFLALFSALLLTGLMGPASADHAPSQTLQLLGRSSVDAYQVDLKEQDWAWLRRKGVLLLGDSAPDYAPFGMTTNDNEYEGITADYAQLISQLLNIKIEVRLYNTRDEVTDALKHGDIDLLGTANGYEAADPTLTMSREFAQDQPTLVTRTGDSEGLKSDLAGKNVAMLYHYLPPKAVQDFYPNANFTLYPSTLSAISAVAFGLADVYLGDAISSNYLISKNYLNNVQLTDFSRMEVQPFAFALSKDNVQLVKIVNTALDAIPISERMNILRRWKGGGSNMSGEKLLHFSSSEQRWLDKHPTVNVVINENFLPLTFLDEQGRFRGVSADVLTKISFRTGLKFNIKRSDKVEDLINLVAGGEADMLAAITPSTEREGKLRFSRPYLTNPFVLVTRSGESSPKVIEDMIGKRLALIRGNILTDYITEHYPNINLVLADNALAAMDLVAEGKVDGAVNTLISASYIISRQYRQRLQVSSTVSTLPARVAFATARGSLELYSILDKALLSIPPEEMDEITNRWRNEVVINNSYWLRNRTLIIQGFALAAVLLLVAIGWIAYLRMLIRKRRQAEIALNDQLEFMHVLIDGTPHPIYVRDNQGRLLICNAMYLEVFSVERETVVGKTVIEGVLSNVSEAQTYHDDYMETLREGIPRIQDRSLTMPDKKLTIYHWMLPYRGSDGEISGMIGGWIDISERQHLVEELQEAKTIADDANRAKTTFLATMSHEIRTPMNAVIGMLELAMKKAEQGVTDRFAIEVASGAAHGLLDLIGDILDVARIESGRLSLAPERANLRELLESVFRIFEGLARQKRLQLLLDLDAESNCDVLIDPLRFKQVVSNLLSNAIKFTAKGQVHLSVRADADIADNRLGIVLRVEDSGSGISQDDQQRLFNPFTQASNNDQSARSGSGLGLVISRTLCEMMGGHLHLASELGKGTQIEVQLSFSVLEPINELLHADNDLPTSVRPLNILIVDDYPANRLLLSQQLNYLGHRVKDAEDGAHGLRAWRNEHFDVVITDCNMPIMNGYEFTRAIRAEEAAQGREPGLILGFTANAQAEEKNRCAAAGMDDCLFKPTSLKDLSQRLAKTSTEYQSPPYESLDDEYEGEFDLTSLEQLTRGDRESIKSLLDDLVRSNEDDMARLIRLFTARDLVQLADLAHRVKGGARIIKARALVQCCENLESICKTGGENSKLVAAVDRLRSAMEALAQQLENYDA